MRWLQDACSERGVEELVAWGGEPVEVPEVLKDLYLVWEVHYHFFAFVEDFEVVRVAH